MSTDLVKQNKILPKGGGEMGELIRAKDWSKTSLGDPGKWPQSLLTALGIVINSKFPMFIFWGPELICFYNDAYRPSLGNEGKHPLILGGKGEDAWPEIWDTIKPLIDEVLAGGEASWNEDQLLPIYRNGKLEDVYCTFSYSPIIGETGNAVGVFIACSETTGKIKLLHTLTKSEDQLNFTIDASGLATWDLNPVTNKFTGNIRIKEWFGLTPESEIDLPLALNNIIERDRQKVTDAIKAALMTGSDGNYDIAYTIVHPLTGKERRVLARGKALFENDKAYRFSGILEDVSVETEAAEKLKESEKQFRNIVKQAPLGITILRGRDFFVEMANETYLKLVDRKEEDFTGKPLFEALPEVKETAGPLLKNVLKTGQPFYGTEYSAPIHRHGQKETIYFNFVYYPLREEDGEISGIIVVATEVTESVKAKQALVESEKQFRNLVMQSPIPMTIFKGKDYVIEIANKSMIEDIWKKKEEDVIGKKVLEVFPELSEQKYPELLNEVYATGKTHRETESVAFVQTNEGMIQYYLDFEYAPFLETGGTISGIIITVNNVTEKVEARQKVEESEERLNIVITASELATWELNMQTSEVKYSNRYLEIFGYPKDVQLTHSQIMKHLHPDDLHIRTKAFTEAYKTGTLHYVSRITWNDNSIHWIEGRGKVFYDDAHNPIKLIGTIRDITEEKNYQQQLEEREQKFRLLADSMPQHVWTSDPEGNLNYFNQSVYDYSGLSPEDIATNGWLQIVHPDDRKKNIALWSDALESGNDFLLEHRFKRSDGVYRWQLTRAIPQKDGEGTIQQWVGTSTDIQDQKNFAGELEKQIQERTSELKQKNNDLEKMNAELQSFAYVSSHDLQEPLRKIQTFASRILEKEFETLSDSGKDYFIRMQDAAKRMQTLIEDLLAYSRTNTTERIFKTVPLNQLVDEVKQELKELIFENNAVIEVGQMIEARVIPFQFRQLLHNLIGNSIKFAKQGIPSHIKIESKIVEGKKLNIAGLLPQINYCQLTLSDNGIGFDSQYKERIFEVFQRLHAKSEYKGTGIGLAIVKKIVENHNGAIVAKGEINKGARFDIYIPAY